MPTRLSDATTTGEILRVMRKHWGFALSAPQLADLIMEDRAQRGVYNPMTDKPLRFGRVHSVISRLLYSAEVVARYAGKASEIGEFWLYIPRKNTVMYSLTEAAAFTKEQRTEYRREHGHPEAEILDPWLGGDRRRSVASLRWCQARPQIHEILEVFAQEPISLTATQVQQGIWRQRGATWEQSRREHVEDAAGVLVPSRTQVAAMLESMVETNTVASARMREVDSLGLPTRDRRHPRNRYYALRADIARQADRRERHAALTESLSKIFTTIEVDPHGIFHITGREEHMQYVHHLHGLYLGAAHPPSSWSETSLTGLPI